MEIGAAEYRLAAPEMLEGAILADGAGKYIASHYLSGLAVECTLRAYRWRIDTSWDGRHVLLRLAKAARFYEVVPDTARETFQTHFGEIARRWANDHRYSSASKLEKYLNSIGATVNVKGNKLKENSRVMTEGAHFIVSIGESQWNRRT